MQYVCVGGMEKEKENSRMAIHLRGQVIQTDFSLLDIKKKKKDTEKSTLVGRVGLEFHLGHIEFSCLLDIQVKMWKISLEAGE